MDLKEIRKRIDALDEEMLRLLNQRAEIVTQLAGKYKEVPVAIGVNSKGHLVEVLSSEHGRTWTIIVTSPAGMSCVVSVGEDWSTRQQDEQQAEPQV